MSAHQRKPFEELVAALCAVDLHLNVSQWHDEEHVEKYRDFFTILGDALEHFSLDDAERAISVAACRRLLNLLYAVCLSSIARLSVAHSRAKDVYAETPLVTLYLGAATCILYLRDNTTFTGRRDMFVMEQNRIEYCTRHRLDVKHKTPIERFTFEDVALSFLKLEMNMASLEYSPDLEAYIDALELRLCELLLHTNSDAILNNTTYRTKIPSLDNQYCCSTSGEYYLIVSALAMRKLLTSALPVCRADGVQRSAHSQRDLDMIERLAQIFTVKYKNVHSDDIDDKFSETYKEQKTFLFEIYLFQKLNGAESRLDYASIVSQFRNRTYWDNIANASHSNIGRYLESPDENCVAFRVLFMQMAELLFQQQLHISWEDFCLNGEQLYKMDRLSFEDFSKRSHRQPYFVRSLNDACIFFRGQLFIFGCDARHYFHAFKEWLDIVASECNYMIHDDTVSIRPLLDYICNDLECLRVLVKEDDRTNETPIDEAQLSQRKRTQLRAHEAFKYILTGLNSEAHTADSSNTIGDIDAIGLENSTVCGWSFT